MSQEVYLTEIELFERWGKKVSLKTLRNWRSGKKNNGPNFVKFGQRVLYPQTGLEEYENGSLVESDVTSHGVAA